MSGRARQARRAPKTVFDDTLDPSFWDEQPTTQMGSSGSEMKRIQVRLEEALDKTFGPKDPVTGETYKWTIGFASKFSTDGEDNKSNTKGTPYDPMFSGWRVLTPGMLSDEEIKFDTWKARQLGVYISEALGAVCWRNMIVMVTRNDWYKKKVDERDKRAEAELKAPEEPDVKTAVGRSASASETKAKVPVAEKQEILSELGGSSKE